ncbi:hypothetical protein [Cryptosporangium sp. NPDC051539]|uniref:hypothetical protein n=1 Tax=Cryptosporangium sp. NPDC051539 TaxID=3363962 RepID=UPI003798B955
MNVLPLHPVAGPAAAMPASATFTAWGAPVEITAPAALLPGCRALVARLQRLWNPTIPGSDLHRLYASVGTVVPVEPETVALVELAARAARHDPHPPRALHDVVVDPRHGRAGLPEPELLDFRTMIPVLTAALLVRFLQERGAGVARVRIGPTERRTDTPAA